MRKDLNMKTSTLERLVIIGVVISFFSGFALIYVLIHFIRKVW